MAGAPLLVSRLRHFDSTVPRWSARMRTSALGATFADGHTQVMHGLVSHSRVHTLASGVLALLAIIMPSSIFAAELNERCVVNVLNRTIQVSADGGWSLPNVPSNQGSIRARATCLQEDGQTVSGQSGYFQITANQINRVSEIVFEDLEQIPVALEVGGNARVVLNGIGATFSLTILARYADGSTRDVTGQAAGTNYASTNPAVVSVSADGLLRATGTGVALLTVRKDGVLASRSVAVQTAGDVDGDGLPDAYESLNGLNPNDPIDAQEDEDRDGLSALEEFAEGTNPNVSDTDGDGLEDGEEVRVGEDGFVTNPLRADSDGDGLNDALEVAVGSSPNDGTDRNLEDAVSDVVVSPSNVALTYNTIDGEVSRQLKVTGQLLDGNTLDLTDSAFGTDYSSSDDGIASFGVIDGEVFGGAEGSADVTVRVAGYEVLVPVAVESFAPRAVASLSLPGDGRDTDVSGDTVYVATSAGMHIVDVQDREFPVFVSTFPGDTRDVKVQSSIAYLAQGNRLLIVDVSDSSAATLIASHALSGVSVDLSVQDGMAYIAVGTAGVDMVDVTNPLTPFTAGRLSGADNIVGVAVEGDRLAALSASALTIVDI